MVVAAAAAAVAAIPASMERLTLEVSVEMVAPAVPVVVAALAAEARSACICTTQELFDS